MDTKSIPYKNLQIVLKDNLSAIKEKVNNKVIIDKINNSTAFNKQELNTLKRAMNEVDDFNVTSLDNIYRILSNLNLNIKEKYMGKELLGLTATRAKVSLTLTLKRLLEKGYMYLNPNDDNLIQRKFSECIGDIKPDESDTCKSKKSKDPEVTLNPLVIIALYDSLSIFFSLKKDKDIVEKMNKKVLNIERFIQQEEKKTTSSSKFTNIDEEKQIADYKKTLYIATVLRNTMRGKLDNHKHSLGLLFRSGYEKIFTKQKSEFRIREDDIEDIITDDDIKHYKQIIDDLRVEQDKKGGDIETVLNQEKTQKLIKKLSSNKANLLEGLRNYRKDVLKSKTTATETKDDNTASYIGFLIITLFSSVVGAASMNYYLAEKEE